MMFLLVVSLITLPNEGFDVVQQILLKDKKAREFFLANVDNCSTIFIYLDVEDKKAVNWLKDVAHLFSHKDFIFYHASWNATKRNTPNWLKHVPGLVTFSFPTCTIGAGRCNQMARLTSNSTNLKPIRKCKCHKRSFSDGFARTDSILGLMQWYGDNVLRVEYAMKVAHNLYQTENSTTSSNALITPTTEYVPCDYGSHRALIGESSITLTAKALKSARTEAYPTEAAEKKRDAKRAAKAAGTEVKTKKRPKKIQDHFDDCGTSLDGLGVELEIAYYEESDTSGSDFSDDDAVLYDSSHSFLFAGSEGILPDANSEAASQPR
jgi:hypothetical protein